MKQHTKSQPAFTIVELLIVIVVIGILAAITVVAYNGIQDKAKVSQVVSALNQVKKKLELYKVENGAYPSSGNLANAGVSNSDVAFQYTSDGSSFCVTGTAGTISYKLVNASVPVNGGCSGHGQGGIAAVTNYSISPHAYGGWGSQTPSGSTMSYSATGANDGGSAYQINTTMAGQLRINIPQSMGVLNVNDMVGVAVDVFSPVSTTAQIELGINNTYYPKSNSFNINPGWNRVYGEVTIPTGSAGNLTMVQVLGASNSVLAGQTWRASRAYITKGPNAGGYFDGNSSNWIWNGAQNSSTSTGPAT